MSTVPMGNIEGDVQTRGKKLLGEVRRQEAKGSPTEWFYDNLMALTTKDEKLKVELFRSWTRFRRSSRPSP